MKEFNTTGPCVPSKHYMVDISQKVREIERLVDAGKYFTINRARQYGKTTTLAALKHALIDRYMVLDLDFQSIDNDVFESGATFSQAMARIIVDEHEFEDAPIPMARCEVLHGYAHIWQGGHESGGIHSIPLMYSMLTYRC